ncbi:Early nodulin-like protein 1 [Senna tora]|uniref:Early nodulin-like protein 1 n=1 Tax=Senna tora TaxID=362788 RepID=A0A834XDI6_9FABA|nr:Early nodulin-like protein 1 [Senna tora]
MASSCSSCLVRIVCGFMVISMACGWQFKVGDEFGWQKPALNQTSFYSQWAEIFEYRNDSVLTVEKWDYYHCDGSDPITAFDNGKSIINLDRPGFFFFISGSHDHCINGQRLIVDVMSPHPAASPPSIIIAPSPDDDQEASSSPSPSSSNSIDDDDDDNHNISNSAISLSSSSSMLLLATSLVLLYSFVN